MKEQKGKSFNFHFAFTTCEYQTKMITASHTRETINVSTIAVIHYFLNVNGHLSGASVNDSKYVKMIRLQDFY